MQPTTEKQESTQPVALGVDIGGTNTKFGYVDAGGNCLAIDSMPTNSYEPPEIFFRRLKEHSLLLLQSIDAKAELVGVGIGAPNANFHKGTIERPPNLEWEHVEVGSELSKFFDVPSAVTNDAKAAAIGEMLFGAGQGMHDFILITLGTGLGSGIVSNGQLVYGADGFAGEIGHTIVDGNGRLCGCGRRGCLEAYCSATGACRTAMELMSDTLAPSSLRNISPSSLTAEMISDAAHKGDKLALLVFEHTGRTLGAKLSDSVAHLSPEAIIIAGGLAAAWDLFIDALQNSFEEHLFPIYRGKIKILKSKLIEGNPAVLGASALIWHVLEGKSSHQ
jgi:glucokinase